jgi:hypothetical protein
MLKMFIDDEEVVSKNNFTIKEEILSPSSTILNNTYPKDWEETKDYISNFYMPKDFAKLNIQKFSLVPEIVGTTIQINGSATITDVNTNYQSRVTKLLGQTSQSGTPTPSSPQPIHVVSGDNVLSICGKNLFNKDSGFRLGYIGSDGVFHNESITAVFNQYIPIKAGEDYTISFNQQIRTFLAIYYDENKTFMSRSKVFANIQQTTFTPPTNSKYMLMQFSYNSDTTMTQDIIDSLQPQLEYGSSKTTYEPYIGQDYPIYLGVENLWNWTPSTITLVKSTSRTISIYPTSSITLKAGTYNLCLPDLELNNNNYDLYVQMVGVENAGLALNNKNRTFTISEEKTLTRLYVFLSSSDSDSATATFSQIQITKGSSTQKVSDTPIELCKIGDYQDYIYKENNKWWLYKAIGKMIYTGDSSESWAQLSGSNKFYINLSRRLDSYPLIYSNYYTYNNLGQASITDGQFSGRGGANTYLWFRNDSIANVSAWTTWLSTHNTMVYLPLETPTTTEITDSTLIEQLEALKSDEE